jgi:YVTN family beta-propeller protein
VGGVLPDITMTTPPISAGSIVAGYRIESVAGQGGMGVVYRATQLALGRPVALKLIATELAHDLSFRQRFQRESQIAASIDHPNVIPVYEAGESDDGSLFLAMRYVDGTDLGALVGREGRLATDRATRIVAQIAAALDASHRRSLVHRDVKPANVLLAAEDEHVYLTDFGLTKRTTSAAALTRTGMFVGTLDYCAPEQIRGEPSDGRADVYALGCVLFRCLSGEAPYERDSDVAKMYAHLNDPIPTATALAPDIPAGLDDVLAKALAKEPDARYSTAGELARAALTAIAGTPLPAPAPAAPLTPLPAPVGVSAPATPAPAPTPAPASVAPAPSAAPSAVEDEEPLPWAQRHRVAIGGTLGTVFALALVAVVLSAAGVLGGSDGGGAAKKAAAVAPTATAQATPTATPEPAGQPAAVASVKVGKGPDGITVDEKGVVWVNNHDEGTVSRIDGKTGKVIGQPFQVGRNVDGIATGKGITYVAVAGEDRIQRFEGADEPVEGGSVKVGDDPEAIALGKQLVWVANRRDNSVNRLDRATPSTVGGPIGVGSGPTGIFVGKSTVWVANTGDNTVTRIDPSTANIKGDPIPVGNAPRGIKEGFKSAWVANSDDNTVTRLNRDTGQPIGQPIEVGNNPREIAIGLGFVWVTNRDDGTVTRIDPKTGRVVGNAITVGTRPLGIAVGGGAVWVANHGGDSVTKIQP